MPCINLKVSTKLEEPKKEALKSRLGKAVAILPGKSENWLMVCIEDGCDIWFQGKNDAPLAFVEVKIYGKANAAAYGRLTAELTGILGEEVGIAPDHVYVKYEEVEYWGWNGSNF